LTVDATVLANPSLTGTTADIRLTTEDLAAATALLGLDGLPAGNGTLSGRIAIDESELTASELTASIPGIDVSGTASLARSDRFDGRADLHFGTLELTPYVTADQPQHGDEQAAGQLALHDLYSDNQLELTRLRTADLDLSATIDRFSFGAFVSQDAALRLALARGELRLETLLDGGRVNATVDIDAREDDVGLRVSLSGDAVPLAVDRTAEPAANTPVMDLNMTVAGRGASSRALAESVEGTIELYLTRGRMRSAGFRFLFGSVLFELLDTINPFTERQEFVDIECAGAYFDVVGGVLSTRNGIILQTPGVQIVGIGMANLVDGSLQMEFRTKRRTGVVISIGGIVNEFVELTGTLEAPRVQVSARRASRSGLIALATGGLSLLAADIFGRLTAGDVCVDLPARVSTPVASDD
jgi:uncharacterized protein involved in outer membrane biogenesis